MSLENDFVEVIKTGNIASLEELLTRHPDELGKKLEWGGYSGFALHCAAFYNQPAVIEFLVEKKKMDVNLQTGVANMWTPLHHAESAKAYLAAAALLAFGANPAVGASGGRDTTSFCQSEKLKEPSDPHYQEKKRQKKIAGTWASTTPKEVVHDYELPDNHYRLTDIFNFETRSWRAIAKDLNGTGVAQNILFFDDMPDTEIVHQAFAKLKELGGDADESSIDGIPLRGKQLRSKPL